MDGDLGKKIDRKSGYESTGTRELGAILFFQYIPVSL